MQIGLHLSDTARPEILSVTRDDEGRYTLTLFLDGLRTRLAVTGTIDQLDDLAGAIRAGLMRAVLQPTPPAVRAAGDAAAQAAAAVEGGVL